MAKLVVKYEAVDPYYSDQVQTFIGVDIDSCEEQRYEFEKWLGRNHPAGIMFIYKTKILEEKL